MHKNKIKLTVKDRSSLVVKIFCVPTCEKYYVEMITYKRTKDNCYKELCTDYYCNGKRVYIGNDVNPLILSIPGDYYLLDVPCCAYIDDKSIDSTNFVQGVCSPSLS